MATSGAGEAEQRILRISDIAAESEAMHTPIIDYDKMPTVGYTDTPIVSLEKAVEPLVSLMPAIQTKATEAKRKCKNPPADGLTLDESASIRLYTMEWQPRNKCLYVALNATFRSKNREKLKPWFLYLKLFLTALERLPSKNRTLYRGVKLNLQKEYSKGDTVVWWVFSSSTASIGVLKQDLFLGQSGDRTMFTIECAVGKDIQKHSFISGEDEILILPGSQFKVLDSLDHGHGLHMIQMEQIKHTESLLQQILQSSSTLSPGEAEATPSKMMRNRDHPVIQTFLLIWLDSNIDESKDEYRKSIAKLRQIVNDVYIFTDASECIQFLKSINQEKAFIVISGALGEQVVPKIHKMSQIDAIFVFCGNKSRHEKWTKQWSKIMDVFIDINGMCECIKQAAHNVNQETVAISFTSANDAISKNNLNQLDPSYMYTQILKEVLLQIDFEPKHIQEFVECCREQFASNANELKYIDKFAREYRDHTPIWWYTSECFVYPMVNRALRLGDFDVLIKAGFFICDLHREIAQLNSEQFDVHHHKQSSFIVYHGQGMSKEAFDTLRKTNGGLLSFNNFLSTSRERAVSLRFADHATANPELVGVLFHMTIDPSIPSTPFAFISDVSFFEDGEEILFSMHSMFRVDGIKQIDHHNHDRLYQVDLTLTSDQDPDLRALTKRIREETEGPTGWHRLGNLLLKVDQFEKAAQLYHELLKQSTDNQEKSLLYNQLGRAKNGEGDYEEALRFSERSLEIRQKTLPPNHPDFAQSYNNIGSVYYNMGNYSRALSYHEKALEIRERSLPSKHPDLGESYHNISLVYNKMKEYSKALSFCERAVDIGRTSLPANHPDLQLWKKTCELVKKEL